MSGSNFYITTTLPYVNADPHIGFAMEIIRADVIARYNLSRGADVFFNTGTDEHGQKIYTAANEMGVEPQAYADIYAEKFRELRNKLGLWDRLNFVRTTDAHHIKAAQAFWEKCDANGDIYKKNYKAKYCVGCELERTDSELDERGCCPIHPNKEIHIIEEGNYFFRFSKYKEPLLKLYKERADFVLPDFRLNEIRRFVENGLEDFSISRLKKKMPWGIGVPGDDDHVMYVWFDALVSYISAIGWPDDKKKFETWWPVVQIAGKDNLRQQSAMWQAMLMSAGLEPSKQIIVEGFITSGGEKMSKSLGNVINPLDMVGEYGTDALRVFLTKEMPMFDDGDVTMERFADFYNADLVNSLGNAVSRIMKMAETHLNISAFRNTGNLETESPSEYSRAFAEYDIPRATQVIWSHIARLDADIQKTKPFKLIKTDKQKAIDSIIGYVRELGLIAHMLGPIIPETASKIKNAVAENKKPDNLFPRR